MLDVTNGSSTEEGSLLHTFLFHTEFYTILNTFFFPLLFCLPRGSIDSLFFYPL